MRFKQCIFGILMALNTFVISITDESDFMALWRCLRFFIRRFRDGINRISIETKCKKGLQHYGYGKLNFAHIILSLFLIRIVIKIRKIITLGFDYSPNAINSYFG
ncbi:hypothetical protein SX4_1712 [Vibrio mimicus SX-4]|nr:hypothetical protein SX4_1712 [Vibrio mimicus SX-4]